MYGVRQQIAGRVVAGQQALASAQSAMYDRALQLQRSGADMSGGGAGGGGMGGSVLGMAQVDTQATTGIDSQIGAQGGIPSESTMAGNIAAGVGQGPGSMMDSDNLVTGDAYDEMIAQQIQQQQQAALQQTSIPAPRPPLVVANENKGRIGRG